MAPACLQTDGQDGDPGHRSATGYVPTMGLVVDVGGDTGRTAPGRSARRTFTRGVVALGTFAASSFGAAPTFAGRAPTVGGASTGGMEQVVIAADDPTAAAAAAARAGGAVVAPIAPGYYSVHIPRAGTVAAASIGGHPADPLEALRGTGVSDAYRSPRAHASRTPNDTRYGEQYHLPKISAPQAWDVTTGDINVRVAILDTGIAAHADLPVPVVTKDLVSQQIIDDCVGQPSEVDHGSHVAGIVGARGNNAVGVSGVAWNVALVDVKVLGTCGEGSLADVARGVMFAADAGAKVINMSLGSSNGDPALRAAIDYARARGAVVVAAAGNGSLQDGSDRFQPQFPAAYPAVLAVANTDKFDTIANSSVRGPWVDLAAPGVGILSTLPADAGHPTGTYGTETGTSMSSPMVAGAAALLFSGVPGITPGEVEARLVRSADPVGDTCVSFNSGRLNVAAALANRIQAYGYRTVDAKGFVEAFGAECYLGDTSKIALNGKIVGLSTTPSLAGYRLVASDGGIFSYGDAQFYGSTGGLHLNSPVIGMAPTPTGKGYWLVAGDGGIFSYGDAQFFGSTGSLHLNSPVIGMASTPTGNGYWLYARDGGIFSYGDAQFFGSTGSLRLNSPVVSMAPARDGDGYWMVAGDGGIFAFGSAAFSGSRGGQANAGQVIGMLADPTGAGYTLFSANHGVYTFGGAPYFGAPSTSTGAVAAAA